MSQLFTTPFGGDSTASEVIEGVDLSGRRAIVTGAGSGIGVETALSFPRDAELCDSGSDGTHERNSDHGCSQEIPA
ncbi:hypothetical protein ACIRRI_37720, partial [Streptomyces mirabilis]